MRPITVGGTRGEHDECRRYMPTQIKFDTRANILGMVVEDDWEPAVQAQWRASQRSIREGIVHQYGAADYDQKIADFTALGMLPWTVLHTHNLFLTQVRSAFVSGAYYPALVGACALGERVLNELVLRLRDDYADHPATVDVATQGSFINWGQCIHPLFEWGVISDETATAFNELKKLRHKSVHYGAHLAGRDARDDALEAILLAQRVVGDLFTPFDGPPRFIDGTAGRAFLARAVEDQPLIKHFYLPNCHLVSPGFTVADHTLEIADDDTYQDRYPVLTDAEFAEHRALIDAGTPPVPG